MAPSSWSLADGSRVLEFNEQEAKRLMGLLQLFLFPKEPDPRQQELVRNVEGEELPAEYHCNGCDQRHEGMCPR